MKSPAVRPPVPWHGGKYYLAQRIVALLPPHVTYVEPFGGGASVLVNKAPSAVEVYNDLDGELVNFFTVLRDHSEQLIHGLTLTPYSQAEFRRSNVVATDPVERARRFLVRYRQSLGARGSSFARSPVRESRRGMAYRVSAWLSAVDEVLPDLVARLRRVEMLCAPAVDVIRRYDGPDSVFYCDPPYVHATRAPHSRKVYAVEMTNDDHAQLAQLLRSCKGKVILSGYPSPLYDRLHRSWRTLTFDVPVRASQTATKARRREVLWLNFKPTEMEVPSAGTSGI